MHERSGKIANERPYSSLIEDFNHIFKVHLYIEANPIKARMFNLSNLKNYKYSSFRLFAFGEMDELNDFITIPSWYIALGNTPAIRQKRFRKIFIDYILNMDFKFNLFKERFIGTPRWKHKYDEFVNLQMSFRRLCNSS
ncbi:MAG: hypothetical protein MK008_09100 [Bdellovibrionales bacterium]|nr:hypothetical protein [Bdellovibrionales bacterium]